MSRIAAVRGTQNGRTMYQALMSIKELREYCEVDVMDRNTHIDGTSGYQRRSRNTKKAKDFAKLIGLERDFCPLSIWANDRKGLMTWQPAAKNSNLGHLVLPANYVLYIPDGGNRKEGFVKALEDYLPLNQDLETLDVCLTITQVDRLAERKGFAIINTHAKPVGKTHRAATHFATSITEGLNGLRNDSDKHLAVIFGTIQRLCENKDSILFDMFASDERKRYGKKDVKRNDSKSTLRVIKEASFINNFSKLVNSAPFVRYFNGNKTSVIGRVERFSEVINNYYVALREVTKPMWENPDDYRFFHSVGLSGIAALLDIITKEMIKKDEEPTVSNFRKYIAFVPKLKDFQWWYSTKGVAKDKNAPQDNLSREQGRGSYVMDTLSGQFHTNYNKSSRSVLRSVAK